MDATWDGGWEGHRRAQLRRLAQLSLIEKIEWLDEAHELVRHLRDARGTGEESRATMPSNADGDRVKDH
jgi:hypothetical protein